MKNNSNEIDQIIKDTLTKEEAAFYDSLEEQNFLEMVGGLFTSRHKWILISMNIVQILSFGLFVFCLVQFFNTAVTNELIKWAAGGLLFFSISSMLKVFSWMQMDKNAILRELKRLELQVSYLAGKM